MENKEFHYTYTAPSEEERKEIESIKRQYDFSTRSTTGKLERLRTLDRRVRYAALCWGLSLGVIGSLVFGTGLSCILVWNKWAIGIALSAVGGALAALAYPVYQKVLKRNKKKYGAEILKLSEELLQEN